MNLPRRGIVAAAALAAAGCATPPARAPSDLAGRLALRIDGDAARSFAAEFDLRGDARQGELRLLGALGTTLGQVSWQPGRAELVTAEGSRAFDSLDALAEALFGEALPLAALVDWLRGRPWPGAPNVAHAQGFDQLGWRIDLARYAADGVLEARRERAPGLLVRVRLERPA